MTPECLEARLAAFRHVIERYKFFPAEDSAITVTLVLVATTYLLGLETVLYEKACEISARDDTGLTRKSEITLIPEDKREYRGTTVAMILVMAEYFRDFYQSKEMFELLQLLAELAVDDSVDEIWAIAQVLVIEESLSDPSLWLILEKEFPTLCRLIEKDAN